MKISVVSVPEAFERICTRRGSDGPATAVLVFDTNTPEDCGSFA